jgi:hypothetical protein
VDRINEMCISLDMKNCEPFTMKYQSLFIEVFPLHNRRRPRHGYPMILAVFSSPPSLSGDNGWFPSYCGVDHGGGGGYLLPRGECVLNRGSAVALGARAPPSYFPAFR